MDTLEEALEQEYKHLGPGPHPSGSPQAVHSGDLLPSRPPKEITSGDLLDLLMRDHDFEDLHLKAARPTGFPAPLTDEEVEFIRRAERRHAVDRVRDPFTREKYEEAMGMVKAVLGSMPYSEDLSNNVHNLLADIDGFRGARAGGFGGLRDPEVEAASLPYAVYRLGIVFEENRKYFVSKEFMDPEDAKDLSLEDLIEIHVTENARPEEFDNPITRLGDFANAIGGNTADRSIMSKINVAHVLGERLGPQIEAMLADDPDRVDAFIEAGEKLRVWPERSSPKIRDWLMGDPEEGLGLHNGGFSKVDIRSDDPVSREDGFKVVGRAIASRLVQQWASTSNDADGLSLAIQRAVFEEFGTTQEGWDVWDIKPDSRVEEDTLWWTDDPFRLGILKAFVRASYDETQDMMVSRGYRPDDEVTMWRGVKISTNDMPDGSIPDYVTDPDKSPVLRPISAVTYDRSMGENFATGFGGGFSPTGRGFLLKMKVRVADLFACSMSGAGCLNENEFLVLGRDYEPGRITVDQTYGLD